MSSIVQRVACKALICHNDKILILREAPTYKDGNNIGRYHFPGGRIEVGESWRDGLVREIAEETGLRVGIGAPLFVGEWHPVIKQQPHHIIAIFFVCQVSTSAVTLSDEHDDFQWIQPQEHPSFPIMTPDDEVIEAYIASGFVR